MRSLNLPGEVECLDRLLRNCSYYTESESNQQCKGGYSQRDKARLAARAVLPWRHELRAASRKERRIMPGADGNSSATRLSLNRRIG